MNKEEMYVEKISEVRTRLLSYLQEVLQQESQKLVGKLLKRLEIIDDKDILKKTTKELVYEQFRDLSTIFNSYAQGVESTYFKFLNTKSEEK